MNDLIVDVKLWGESVGSLYWEKESNAARYIKIFTSLSQEEVEAHGTQSSEG